MAAADFCAYPPGTLLGINGSPISSRQFLSAAVNTNPSWPIRALDPLKKLITQRDWLTTSFLSSKIYANVGVIRGIIDEKAMLAIGHAFQPIFLGEAQAWGEEVELWLMEQWFEYCDVRGQNFDFATGLFLDSITIDRDADAVAMYTKSEGGDGKWPMLQHIPTRQIGQWETYGTDVEVKEGRFKGATIRNGVIINRQEQPIGFRKLGDNRGEFEDIGAEVIDQRFEPQWYDQCRGLPVISASIENIRKSVTSDELEAHAQVIASFIGLVETNERGGPNPASVEAHFGQTADGTPTGLQIQEHYGSLIKYIKSGTGSKIEPFVNPRPAQEWENFQDRQVRAVCAGANWDYSYAWKRESVNGTSMRSVLEKIRNSVADRQMLLTPRARRKVQWAVSVAINNGIIPPYPGRDVGGFLKWGFTYPAELSIDPGRDGDSERSDYLLGQTTMQRIQGRRGTTWKKVREQKQREAIDLIQRAQAVVKETGVPFDTALTLMQQQNPNQKLSATDSQSTDTTQQTNQP